MNPTGTRVELAVKSLYHSGVIRNVRNALTLAGPRAFRVSWPQSLRHAKPNASSTPWYSNRPLDKRIDLQAIDHNSTRDRAMCR